MGGVARLANREVNVSFDQFETQSKAIFKSLPQAEPSPYLAARITAKSGIGRSRELVIMRWIAAVSFTAVVALVSFIQIQPKADVLYTYQPYVIQVDFNQEEIKLVESAEVELPEGVNFVSKNEAVKSLRSLRLPVANVKDGKLPFVVVSERSGRIPLMIRMYNANDELVQTKTLTLQFGGKQG